MKKDDVVRMQTPKGYDKVGFIMHAAEQPSSFLVKSEGQEYRRNRRHLLKVLERNEVIEQNSIEENSVSAEGSSSAEGAGKQKYSNVVITRSGRMSKPNPKYKDYST